MFARRCILTLSLLSARGRGDLVRYEGNSFPETEGWIRLGTLDADRWLEEGWFFQHPDAGVWGGPPGGENDVYRRSLAAFANEDTFFIEWRIQTDGPSSDIIGTAPAALAAGGLSVVLYHFTIASDTVRFIRDEDIPYIFADIQPGVPHTYRVEVYNDSLYVWMIDGVIADMGEPEGSYPTSDSSILFAAKYYYHEHTTQWDYIRFGQIPEPATGDFTSDGAIDLTDYYLFHDYASGPEEPHAAGWEVGDFNDDNDIDLQDFAELQNLFAGGE